MSYIGVQVINHDLNTVHAIVVQTM